MLSETLVLAALTVGGISAIPLQSRQSEEWTLQNFTRACNDDANTCLYDYTINENDSTAPFRCTYTIDGTSATSARVMNYTQKTCDGSTQYSLNQGWDYNTDSMTLVPTDTFINYYAFFGYTTSQMVDGQVVTPDETSPAYEVGTFVEEFKRQIGTSQGWSINELTRTCNTSCIYSFILIVDADDPNGGPRCTYTDNGTSTTAAPVNSFYSIPCTQATGFQWSWGYNPTEDSVVMTVLANTSPCRDAFFGYNDVNTQTTFPYQGPNTEYNTTCPGS